MKMAGPNPGHFLFDTSQGVVPAKAGTHTPRPFSGHSGRRLLSIQMLVVMGPRFSRGRHTERALAYSPSFFLRWPSVRSRKALSLMKPAASR